MPFFTITTPEPPKNILIANSLLEFNNEELDRRIEVHKEGFRRFWYSTDGTTPEEIAEALGTNGALFYYLSLENISHIITSLTIAGLKVDEHFPPNFYTPPRSLYPQPDGTLLIEPLPKKPEYLYMDFDYYDGEAVEFDSIET